MTLTYLNIKRKKFKDKFTIKNFKNYKNLNNFIKKKGITHFYINDYWVIR